VLGCLRLLSQKRFGSESNPREWLLVSSMLGCREVTATAFFESLVYSLLNGSFFISDWVESVGTDRSDVSSPNQLRQTDQRVNGLVSTAFDAAWKAN